MVTRVTQGMAVLSAPVEVLQAIEPMERAGTPLTERLWREVSKMPVTEAVLALGAR